MTKKITKQEWLKANGFSADGVTHLVMGNSYNIKDALKEAGFKYSPLLRWHGPDTKYELPESCSYYRFDFDEIYVWDTAEGTAFLQNGAREMIDRVFNPVVESNSHHVGNIGDRLRDVEVVVRHVAGYESVFGYKWIYTFEDKSGNRYSWFTTSQQEVSVDMKVMLTGTVKTHGEYRGVPTTQLNRCVLKDI